MDRREDPRADVIPISQAPSAAAPGQMGHPAIASVPAMATAACTGASVASEYAAS